MRASFKATLISSVLLLSLNTFAVGPIEEDRIANEQKLEESQGWRVEFFNYQDYIWSESRRTEIGDQVKLDGALRYQYSPNTFGRFRLQTDPNENRFSNKTSNFELLLGHKVDDLTFQFDGEFNTNDGTTGGTSFGFDVDSRLTFVAWQMNDAWKFTFFPFNFDGEVGHDFNTWDVTRLYYIQGAPTTVNNGAPLGSETIASKTIPGIEFAYAPGNTTWYVGVGAASYEYPANGDFDIIAMRTASRWERREDVGWKAGFISREADDYRTELRYVGHNKASETGALLAEAASLYTIHQLTKWTVEAEVTYSKAGDRPFRLNNDGTWFEETAPYQPIYADHDGNLQDWLGKGDFAYGVRLGYRTPTNTPYLSFKHQGEYFIFRERESAQRLRTFDEKNSHGGLNRFGVGTYIYRGDFVVNPEFEWMVARNEVFGNSSDVRQDRFLSTFGKQDFVLFLTLAYQFGGNKAFRP